MCIITGRRSWLTAQTVIIKQNIFVNSQKIRFFMWTHCKNNHISIVDSDISTHVYQLPMYFDVAWIGMGKVYTRSKSCKTYENTVKSPKCLPFFTFSKVGQFGIFVWPILAHGPHVWHPWCPWKAVTEISSMRQWYLTWTNVNKDADQLCKDNIFLFNNSWTNSSQRAAIIGPDVKNIVVQLFGVQNIQKLLLTNYFF